MINRVWTAFLDHAKSAFQDSQEDGDDAFLEMACITCGILMLAHNV
jgi:hypothetical protein